MVPLGGPVLLIEQLRQIPSLRLRDYERLEPYLAALPSDSQLNVNTASLTVLKSLLPGAKTAGLEQILRNRRQRPFTSTDAFLIQVAPVLSDAGLPELEELRFGIGSVWFHADIAVELEGLILRRPKPYSNAGLCPLGHRSPIGWRADHDSAQGPQGHRPRLFSALARAGEIWPIRWFWCPVPRC